MSLMSMTYLRDKAEEGEKSILKEIKELKKRVDKLERDNYKPNANILK